ncbi:MAG TPA: MmgE/PrpD family protein [Synergistales bacterium]|nr:MmgE/PrpD family protein [Synergistales bacterium]
MTVPEKGISRRCAEFVTSLDHSDLGRETVSVTKKCIVDWLGCVLGGASTPAAGIIKGVVNEMGGREQATMAGDFSKTSVLQAATVNAYNCHILEMDDVHKSAVVHPAAPVISAAFALGEYLGSSGKEVIEAIVAGYDVMIRIGEAVMPSHYEIWHSTATCGNFGAAAASARLLKLDATQTLYSLGNAGTQAAGLWEFASDNAMTKYLHCGKAAYNGVLSSLMAKRGFDGATRILEGDRGFFRAYSRESDFERSFEDMGRKYKIDETVYKPYASCRHTHGPINGVLVLRSRMGFSWEDVESVTVETYGTALKLAGNRDHSTPPAARFSLAYCLAAAIVFGKVGVEQFREEILDDPRITAVTPRIRIEATPEMDAMHPEKWPSRTTVKLKNGDSETLFVEYPKGDPENTMTDEEIREKYLALSALAIPEEKARLLLDRCYSIEERESMADFFQGL